MFTESQPLLRILITIFLLLTCSLKIFAQDVVPAPDAAITVIYKVTDTFQKEITFQELEIVLFSEPSPHYKVKRRDITSKKIISSEIESYWSKVTHAPEQSFYAHQSLTENPSTIEKNGRVFGRVEIKMIEDNTIIAAWPAFGMVLERGGIYTLTLNVFIPKRGKLVVTELYKKHEYHAPMFRRQQLFDIEGKEVSDILFTKM